MNRWQWALVAALVLGLMLMVACGEDDDEDNAATELMPTAEGNTWIYQVTRNQVTQRDTTVFNRVLESGGETWYGDSRSDDPGTTQVDEALYYRNDTDGLHVHSEGPGAFFPGLLFKYPATVGQTFASILPATRRSVVWRVEGVDASEPTPAGSFTGMMHYAASDSVPVEGGWIRSEISLFAKPGVGLVKQIVSTDSLGVERVETTALQSYTLY